jgi:monofunctional biosynthetic peptidoglycan transglycosylase
LTRKRGTRRKGGRRRRNRWRKLLIAVVLLLGGAVAFVAVTVVPVLLLREVPPLTSAFMLRAHFADPATGEACEEVEYRWVDREEIAGHLPRAIVLAEDQRFLLHEGFDWKSIQRALSERDRSGRLRGASTLTQQVAKNLFLWPGRSWLRKGLEVWFTLWIEGTWSKRRILEVYMNLAQFGPCVFGAEAAARRYFEITAAELDLEQAALLATVLPNPKKLRAWNPGPYAQERQQEVLELLEFHANSAFLRGL